jgi:hypothetical protein
MRTQTVRSEAKEQEKAVAVRAVQQKKSGLMTSAMTDNRHEAVTQRKLAAMITGSPGVVAQKKQPASMAGIIQKQSSPEEEELLQGKLTAQMQSLEEDEITPS